MRAIRGSHGGLGLVREGEEKLSETTLGGGVVSQDRRECSVAQRLGEALTKCFTGTSVVRESAYKISTGVETMQCGYAYLRKHLTTCFRSLTVCWSTN